MYILHRICIYLYINIYYIYVTCKMYIFSYLYYIYIYIYLFVYICFHWDSFFMNAFNLTVIFHSFCSSFGCKINIVIFKYITLWTGLWTHYEEFYLMRLWNAASSNLLVYNMINLLNYEQWTEYKYLTTKNFKLLNNMFLIHLFLIS